MICVLFFFSLLVFTSALLLGLSLSVGIRKGRAGLNGRNSCTVLQIDAHTHKNEQTLLIRWLQSALSHTFLCMWFVNTFLHLSMDMSAAHRKPVSPTKLQIAAHDIFKISTRVSQSVLSTSNSLIIKLQYIKISYL